MQELDNQCGLPDQANSPKRDRGHKTNRVPAKRKGRRALRHRPLLQLPARVRFRCDSIHQACV